MRTLFLSVLCASTAVAGIEHSAHATIWKNYENESLRLGVASGNMTPGTKLILWDCNGNPDQDWNFSPYVNGAVIGGNQYEQMWTSGSTAPTGLPTDNSSRCAAMGNGDVRDGQPVIIWNCNAVTLDQGWSAVYWGSDANGASCYYLVNQKANGINGVSGNHVMSVFYQVVLNGATVVLALESTAPRADQVWCAY